MIAPLLYLVRHGETEWTLNGRHTGSTDIPLTERGRKAAKRLAPALAEPQFSLVLTSPLRRARATCDLAGLGADAVVDGDLVEWDYGAYEGLTAAQIEAQAPGWIVFRHGCPGGETPEQVGIRVDRVIGKARAAHGHVVLFAHGHLFRALAARWLRLPVAAGSHFLLDTATVSILGYYRDVPAIRQWNATVAVMKPAMDNESAVA